VKALKAEVKALREESQALREEAIHLEGKMARLELELFDERTMRIASNRAHAILSNGIKQALKLKNWPDFYKLYGDGLFADGVARLLNEEVDKLRDNCTKEKHEKRKSRR